MTGIEHVSAWAMRQYTITVQKWAFMLLNATNAQASDFFSQSWKVLRKYACSNNSDRNMFKFWLFTFPLRKNMIPMNWEPLLTFSQVVTHFWMLTFPIFPLWQKGRPTAVFYLCKPRECVFSMFTLPPTPQTQEEQWIKQLKIGNSSLRHFWVSMST